MGRGLGAGRSGGACKGLINFNPRSVSSKQLISWHKADSGITTGTGVAAWADQSGNGFTASQATGGLQPALDTSTLNGRPSLNFTSGKYMLFPAGYSSFVTGDDKPFSVFTVMRFVSISVGIYCLPLAFGQNTPSGQFLETAISFSSGIKASIGKNDGSATFSQSTTTVSTNTNYIMQWNYTGTIVNIFANNTQILTNATLNKNSVTLDNAGINITPTASSTDIGTATWYMGEQILYNGILTQAETDNMYQYLKNSWGFG